MRFKLAPPKKQNKKLKETKHKVDFGKNSTVSFTLFVRAAKPYHHRNEIAIKGKEMKTSEILSTSIKHIS